MAVDFNAGDTVRDLERSYNSGHTPRAAGLFSRAGMLLQSGPLSHGTIQRPPTLPFGVVTWAGHFRRNWQVGIGIDPTAEIEGGEGSGQAEVIAAGGVVIKRAKFGQLAFIVNNVPYANRLADGHSAQAPAGWIDAGVNAIVRAFDRSEEL